MSNQKLYNKLLLTTSVASAVLAGAVYAELQSLKASRYMIRKIRSSFTDGKKAKYTLAERFLV